MNRHAPEGATVREAWVAVDLGARLGTTERVLAGVAALAEGAAAGEPACLLSESGLTLACTRVVPLVGWEGGVARELLEAGGPPAVLLLLSGRPAEELPGLVDDPSGWAGLVVAISLDGAGSPTLCHGPGNGLTVLSGVHPPEDANGWLSLPELDGGARKRLREALRATRPADGAPRAAGLARFQTLSLPGHLVDRSDPLAKLLAPLHRQEAERRPVWLWGEGGSGKTALLALAARLEADRWGSVVAVSCRGVEDPMELAPRLAEAAGLDLGEDTGRPEGLAALLSRLEAPHLLVLDDLSKIQEDDGMVPGGWARMLRALARHPDTAVAISSRLCPTFEGDQAGSEVVGFERVELGGMSREEAAAYLAARVGTAGGFPGVGDADARRWIAGHVGTHPLTLSLLAGAILEEGWRAVREDPGIVLGRARERFLDRMWKTLTADEATARLVHALAVLELPVPRAALRTLAGSGPLERLDRWSVLEGPLVARERWAAPHPVIATDWRRRLPEALPEEARRELASRVAEVLAGEGKRLGIAELHAEAVRLFLEAGRTADAVALLGAGLDEALDRLGLWRMRGRLLRRLLEAEDLEPEHRAGALHNLASALQRLGDPSEAERLFREAMEIRKDIGDRSGIAKTLHNLAILAQGGGELDEAERLCREALAIFEELGERSGIASTLGQLGILARKRGEFDKGERLHLEALKITTGLGNRSGIASTLVQLGVLAQERANPDQAERLYQKSLEIENDLGNQWGIATALHQLGIVAQNRGDLGGAERLYRGALKIRTDLGDRSGIANTLAQLGTLALTRGELDEAERLLREALAVDEDLGDHSGIANTLAQLGTLALKRGYLDEAERLYRQALKIFEELRQRSDIGRTLHQMGNLAYLRDQLDEGERLYRQALAIFKELGKASGIAKTLAQLGILAEHRGDLDEAEHLCREALEIFEQLGERWSVAATLGQLAMLAEARGDGHAALKGFRRAMRLFDEIGAAADAALARYHVARLLTEGSQEEAAALPAAQAFHVFTRSGDGRADHLVPLLAALQEELGLERLHRAFSEALGELADAAWQMWQDRLQELEQKP